MPGDHWCDTVICGFEKIEIETRRLDAEVLGRRGKGEGEKGMDYSKLKGLMREKGMTQAMLAKEIGMTEWTLNAKLKNKSYFKTDEVLKIAEVLNILDDIDKYFFCKDTSENQK